MDYVSLGERRVLADISSLLLPPTCGQQISAVTLEAGLKNRSLEVEVMDSQIEPKVKLLELKVIKMEGDSSHYRLGDQDFDQAGDYKSCGTSK